MNPVNEAKNFAVVICNVFSLSVGFILNKNIQYNILAVCTYQTITTFKKWVLVVFLS